MDPDTLLLLPEEIKEEEDWLRSLGLKLPEGGLLVQQPFASPIIRRSFIVPSHWHWQPPQDTVAPEDLARDLVPLRLAAEKAYIGWERAAATGWDWDDFFDRWHRKLMSDRRWEIPAHEAFTPWYKLLEYQPDNHSGPRLANPHRDFARTVYFLERPSSPIKLWRNRQGATGPIDSTDPAQVAWEAFLPDLRDGRLRPIWGMSHPARYGNWEAVEAGGTWLPVQNANGFEEERFASVSALLGAQNDQLGYRRLSRSVAYLRIPTLSYSLAYQAIQHGDWFPDDGFKVKDLVVDLRGNGGGAADVVFALLNKLQGWREHEDISFSISWKESCVADALLWGNAQYHFQGAKGPLPTRLRQTVQAILYRVLLPSDLGCPVIFREHRSKWGYRQHRFPSHPQQGEPRLILLTDGDCGSDGEFLVFALALIPGSIVVGTCTAGVGQFARPGYFVLPSTRVGFRLAAALSDILGDGSSFDGYGLKMDVLTPQDAPLGVDALQRVIALLP
jgi:hypothetical protein